MGDREIDLEDAPVGDLARIVGDLHQFRVARVALRGHLVMRGRLRAAGVAGDGVGHAGDMLKDALNAPKHPPAITAVSDVLAPTCSSTVGAGTLRASSAVDRVTKKAAPVRSPMRTSAGNEEPLLKDEIMALLHSCQLQIIKTRTA